MFTVGLRACPEGFICRAFERPGGCSCGGMRFTVLASCCLLAATASACTVTTGTESTTKYQTSDLAPSFIATSDGSTLTVRAQLFAPFGSRALALGDGDQLQVTLDGASIALAPDDDAYEGRTAQPKAPALGLVQVLFLRTKTTGEATASTVFVPEPFVVDSSPDAWSVSDDSELAIRTHGIKGSDVDVLLEGRCLREGHQALKAGVGSNGDVLISTSRVEFEDAPDCDLDVSLRVTKTGAVDPTLSVRGGEGIRAVQERRFTVHVAS